MISSVSPIIETSKNKFLLVVTRHEDNKTYHEEFSGPHKYLSWCRLELLRHMQEQHTK